MTLQSVSPLFCNNIGNPAFDCCYAANQGTEICRNVFKDQQVFANVCDDDCLINCADVNYLYGSVLEVEGLKGSGIAPIRRYSTCANVPNIAGYLDHNILEPSILSQVEKYIPRNTSRDNLKHITFALTDCLTATCRNARQPSRCEYTCSRVNLLMNGTTPNVKGLSKCLETLCTGEESSLPFADADVVGVGVFASYIMQCAFVVILWFIFTGIKIRTIFGRETTPTQEHTSGIHEDSQDDSGFVNYKEQKQTQQGMFVQFLEQFHKAQCYFSATIQIAALSYGIFDTDMLVTFMLVPLATNGVLPVVFTLFLLYDRDTHLGADVILLTTICWILSSLVYWTLYSHVIPINSDLTGSFMRIGNSTTSLLRSTLVRGIVRESHKIRVYTPIIWTYSTICLLAILGAKLFRIGFPESWTNMVGTKKKRLQSSSSMEMVSLVESGSHSAFTNKPNTQHAFRPSEATRFRRRQYLTVPNIMYTVVTLAFVACIGMQLSLLSISTSLKMMDRKRWTFGQVIAVTIWVPPLMGYLYCEVEEIMRRGREPRKTRR